MLETLRNGCVLSFLSCSPACPEPCIFAQASTNWVGLIDEWAGRFFAELDYEAEAASALQFKREMAKLEGIVVPDVFLDLTSPTVLTTAWVEGTLLRSRQVCGIKRSSRTCVVVLLLPLQAAVLGSWQTHGAMSLFIYGGLGPDVQPQQGLGHRDEGSGTARRCCGCDCGAHSTSILD